MRRRGERGVILVAVLLAVAIMSVMVVAIAALTRAGIGNERLEQRRLASHFALRSGIEAAKAAILALPPEKRLLLDGSDFTLDLGNGLSATARVRDAAGLVDVNRSDPALIEAAARFAGLSANSAKDLSALVERLRKAAEPAGAAREAKPAQQAAKQPANPAGKQVAPILPAADPNQPPPPVIFLAVDQLAQALDLSPADGRQLEQAFTVFNPTGAINPLAAPDQVLASVPGLSAKDLGLVSAARKSAVPGKDAGLQQLVERSKGLVALGEPSVFLISVTLDEGPGVLAGSTADAAVRLQTAGPLPFGTLALVER